MGPPESKIQEIDIASKFKKSMVLVVTPRGIPRSQRFRFSQAL